MQVLDVSRVVGVGVQVVIGLRPEPNTERRIITSESPEWPRFQAMAKRLAADEGIRGQFERADVQPDGWSGRGVEVQFSWKETHDASSQQVQERDDPNPR